MKIHRLNSNDAFGKMRSIGSVFAVMALAFGIIAFAGLLVLAPSASAQKITGLITGTVSDPSGAVVPGAKVMVTNAKTGVVSATQTNGEGHYTLPYLPPGQYEVAVTKDGFDKARVEGVNLTVGLTATINVALRPGLLQQDVVVTSTAVLLSQQTSAL